VILIYWIACSIGYQRKVNTQKRTKCGHVTENVVISSIGQLIIKLLCMYFSTVNILYYLLMKISASCEETRWPADQITMGLALFSPSTVGICSVSL